MGEKTHNDPRQKFPKPGGEGLNPTVFLEKCRERERERERARTLQTFGLNPAGKSEVLLFFEDSAVKKF